MKYALFLLPVLLWQNNNTEPTIQNVQFKQSGQQVIITYDIANAQDWQTFDIEVFYSGNGGYSYGKALQAVEGDIGYGIKGGNNKRIVWRVLDEKPNGVVGNRIKFKVEATVKGKAPTLTVPDNMVYVEGGTFQMGSEDGESNEKPVHTVTVSSFYISKYETSVAEFRTFVNATGYKTDAEKGYGSYIYNGISWVERSGLNWRNNTASGTAQDNHPVVHVSWNDAKAYCDWKTKQTGKKHRLPTEAEWEYAARGGNKSRGYKYAGSNTIDEVAWYSSNAENTTHRKGMKKANELGLYDMSGNVFEWCSDWYASDYYSNSPRNNPTGVNTGLYYVVRGGAWRRNLSYCRAAHRGSAMPDFRSYHLGFRLVVQ